MDDITKCLVSGFVGGVIALGVSFGINYDRNESRIITEDCKNGRMGVVLYPRDSDGLQRVKIAAFNRGHYFQLKDSNYEQNFLGDCLTVRNSSTLNSGDTRKIVEILESRENGSEVSFSVETWDYKGNYHLTTKDVFFPSANEIRLLEEKAKLDQKANEKNKEIKRIKENLQNNS